jgi:hypothetical protein
MRIRNQRAKSLRICICSRYFEECWASVSLKTARINTVVELHGNSKGFLRVLEEVSKDYTHVISPRIPWKCNRFLRVLEEM